MYITTEYSRDIITVINCYCGGKRIRYDFIGKAYYIGGVWLPFEGCKCPITNVVGGGKGYFQINEMLSHIDIVNFCKKWTKFVHRKKWYLCMTEMSFMPWPLHRDIYGQGFLKWKEEMNSIYESHGWGN